MKAILSVGYCCTQLADLLGTKVSFPGNTTYLSIEDSYWSLQEATLSPSCIVSPESAQDVAEIISTIAGVESCKFAIKGQGHAPAAGFANIEAGITIDTTQLNSVTVNEDYSVASVGAGASWLDVYVYLDPLGVTVAGGRNGAVGVGGLTTGGGISYFSPRAGFTCDTVVNFQIVIASGKLVNANATSYPDLFRALKGGSNNFGVVTRIDFATLKQGQILGGSLVQSISDRKAIFKAFADIAAAPNYDEYASIVLGAIFNSTSKAWVLSSSPIYTKPVLEPPAYSELFAIPNITSTLKITNLSVLAAEAATPKLNWLFYTGTYGVSALLLNKIFDICNETVYNFDIPEGILWDIAFEPLPTVITQYGAFENSLGTSPADGNGFVILVSALWDDTASNASVEKTAQTMMAQINGLANRMKLLHRFQYLNYANPSQNPIGSYGTGNDLLLKATSSKYDPSGVFQKHVPGGFKLGLYY